MSYNNRIPSGIQGVDEILNGGFIQSSCYLLVGATGTGKTIFSLQWLKEMKGKKGSSLFISIAEPVESIRRNAEDFRWDLDSIAFEDLTFRPAVEGTEFDEYGIFTPSEVEEEPLWKKIYDAIDKNNPKYLVIDSLTYLRYLSTDEYQFRKHIQRLVNWLNSKNCTTLLLLELSDLEKDVSVSLAVDGVVILRREVSEGRLIDIRSLEVAKLRGSSYISGRHPLKITENGIKVFPHIIEKIKHIAYARKQISSGIKELDEILYGGIQTGISTLISGPSGTGKTTLALQYLVSAADQGLKSVLYSFEEGKSSILERCNAIGIPVEEKIENNMVEIVEVNTLELYPDEFLMAMKNEVKENKRSLIVIDSLRGYNLAMEQFGYIVPHIQNIINYCRMNKLNLFLINELEKLTGELQITETGVSYIADLVLMLRYAEYNGEVIKIISCLKNRIGNHEPELREYKITEKGILIGEKLDHLRGLLTGVPTAETPEKKPEIS
ncbi:MAG: hypothetical protein D6734_06555 [Candidatus Schekmanbacteria bacterium]|nr:MAG: hypothetical protein D6734_06555 [Candidatus Schekmanbacteria bacterium]